LRRVVEDARTITTRDPEEIQRFSGLAEAWYDIHGPYAPLHQWNPVRLRYIVNRTTMHFGRDPESPMPLQGLSVLDIGCGGGLLAEPLARLGGRVTAIDPVEPAIAIARHHASQLGLSIDYRATTAEEIAREGQAFDIVLNINVLPHVANVTAFMETYSTLLAQGGCTVASSLNRTLRSYCYIVLGLERVLRWIPKGTHDWRRFVRPDELCRLLEANGVEVVELVGFRYKPFRKAFVLTRDLGVQYAAFGIKR